MRTEEQKGIDHIERTYLDKRHYGIYVACEDMNFIWSRDELTALKLMWNDGISFEKMVKFFKRDPDELAVLIIDRVKKDVLKPREGGIFGC